jgi:hypothetical protein
MIANDLSAQSLAILLLGVIFSSEALLRLPLRTNLVHLAKLLKRIFRTLRSPYISDHWKEQVILRYAANLLGYALMMPVQLGVAFIPLSLALWLATATFEQILVLGLEPIALLCITIVSSLYLFLRLRRNV